MTAEQAEEKSQAEMAQLLSMFMDQLGIDEEVAEILAREGFSSVEEVAYVPVAEMLEIEEFDEDIVNELRARAKDILVTEEISNEEPTAAPRAIRASSSIGG